MRVLVTGGAGFIGAHLVARLVQRFDEVIVFDNLKRGYKGKLALRSGRVRLVVGDIRRFDELAQVMRGCETVFHLAAQSNVMGAVDDPDYSITTNVLGTHNVLRCAAEARVGRVVFTSSREVYGDPAVLPVAESQPLLAKNPYGASKAAGEAYCRTFASTLRLPVHIVRLANVYGPGDSGRVIPLWLSAAQRGHDLHVYGGGQVLDFVWIDTVVQALLYAADNGLPGPVNIGSGVATTILDLASRVLEITGSASRIVRTAAREIEVAKFVADTRLMRSLGLVPDTDPLRHLAQIAPSYAPAAADRRDIRRPSSSSLVIQSSN